MCSMGLIVSINSGNCLVPNREEAITLINVNQDVWCHIMSQAHNELVESYTKSVFIPLGPDSI